MKKLLLTLAIVAIAASGAAADILWDQSNYDPNYGGFWNSESGCAANWSGATIHQANDISINDYVTIESITTYYDRLEFGIEGATQAYLWIAPKTGPLPIDGVDDPRNPTTLVPVTVTNDAGTGGNAYVVNASGLNVFLVPGEYWVSLTPIFPGGFWGPSYNIRTLDPWGDDTAYWEICAQVGGESWGISYPDNDASMLIEGHVDVVPNEQKTWGSTKALFR